MELEISNREKSLKETEIKHMQYVYVIDKDSEKVEQQTLQEERKQSQIPLKSGSDVNAATPASVTHHTNSVNNIDDYSVNIASRNGENHFSDDSTTSSKLATRTSHNLESHKEQIHHLDHSSNRSYTSILKNSVNSTNEKFEDQSVDLSMSVSSAGESKSHYSQELHHNKVGTSSVHSTQTAESESRSIKNSIQRESTNASYRSTTNHAASISDSHRSHTLSLEMPTDLREREIFDRNRNQLIELMTQSEKAVIGERSIALAQSKKGTEDDLRHTLQLLQGNIGNKVQQSRKSSPSRLPYNPFEFEMVRKEIKVRVLSELLKRDLSLAELIQATSLLANKSTGMSGESDTSVTPLKILSSMLKRDLSLADLTDAATLIAHSREDKDKLLAALTADLGPSLPQLKNGDQDNIGNASITSDHSTSKTKSPELYDRYGRLLPEFRHLRSSNSSRGSNASSPNSSKAGPSQDSSPIRSSSPNGSRVYKAPPSSTQVKRNSRDSSGGIALADDLSVASMKSSSVQGNSVAFPSPLRTAGRCIACKDRRSHESSSVTSSQLSVSSSKQRKIVKHSGKCEMCGSAKVESSSQLYGDERGSAALTRSDLSATRYDDESESEDDRSKSVSFSIDSDPRSNSERESMIPRRSREKHRRSGSTNEISTQTTSVGSPRKSLFQGKDNRDSPIDAKRSLNYSNVGGKSPRAKFQDSLASSTGSADSYDKRKRTDRLEQQKVEIEELKKAQQQLMEMVMGFKNGSPGGNPKQSSDSQNPDIKNRGTFLLIPTESSPQILRSLSRSIDSAEKKGNEEQEDEIVSSSSSKRSPRSSRSIGRNRSEDHSADEISSKKGSLALSSSHDDLKKTNSDDYYKHSIEEDGLVEDHYDHNVHNEYGDYWREVVQFLRHRISRCLHRYDTAKMEERVDPLSGTVVSEDGRLSLAHMEVKIALFLNTLN